MYQILFIFGLFCAVNCGSFVPDLNSSKPDCQLACTKNIFLLCGINKKGEQKTFLNECLLGVENCKNPSNFFEINHFGECKNEQGRKDDCGIICHQSYQPVCASNGKETKTFANECLMELENCKSPHYVYEVKSPGECETDMKCDHYCPLNYDPLCAFNGRTHKTFTNKCYLDRHNCVEQENFETRFNGTCWNFEINCDAPESFDIKPICAFDGVLHRTFDNEDRLNSYNCPRNIFIMQKKFNGKCGETFEAKKCDLVCDSKNESAAICGCNDHRACIDFESECELRKFNCLNQYEMTLSFKGKCGSKENAKDH